MTARLTQESLADRAGLSAKGIQKLERGGTQPYRDTLRRLVQALDLTGEELIAFQVAGTPTPRRRGESESAPPLDRPASLPAALTSFIGRERETDEIARLLSSARLVTLTGVGGCGKTRLALEVAKVVRDQHVDGVYVVTLASIADPQLVPYVFATALGAREVPTQPLLATIAVTIKQRRILVVLDNCEHLLEACAQIVDALLRSCWELRILATSREPMRVAGEVNHVVPPLAVPPLEPAPTVEQVDAYAAVRLFAARSRLYRSDFAITARNAAAIAELCARLDGIPLALELAAALMRGVSVEDAAARLDRRFRLLTGGSPAAPPRQQTLRAAIDWSYDLLSAPERVLFSRLSIFRGRWPLDAAEDVCGGNGISREQVMELLLRLVDKSLVVVEADTAGIQRYRLLDTLREYGRERLLEADEADAVQRQHATYHLALAKRLEPEPQSPRQAIWIERLAAAESDLLAALEWSGAHGFVQDALRLAGVASRVWQARGQLREGRRRLAAVLALPGADEPTLARARVLHAAGVLALYQGDVLPARAYLKESLALYRSAADVRGVAWVLIHLGWVCHDSYRNRAARRFLNEALAVCRQIGDRPGAATCLSVLRLVVIADGDVNTGRAIHEEALALSREGGNRWTTAWALTNLGAAHTAQIDLGQADAASTDAVLGEAIAIWEEIGERRHLAFCQVGLAKAALARCDIRLARHLLEEGLSTFTDLQDVVGTDNCLANWAELFRTRDQYVQCVHLLAATYGHVRGRFPRLWAGIAEQRLDTARRALGAERFEAAWQAGYAMTQEEAVAYARRHSSLA